jgi:hypothetical protein
MEYITKHKNKIIVGIISFVAALLIFQAGIFVGYHKAFFSYSGGDRFYRMMEGGRPPMMGPQGIVGNMMFFNDNLSPSHGVSGKVVSVTPPSFIVAASNNLEKTVVMTDDTVIRKFRDTVTQADIHAGDYTLILGEPDSSGNIQARFIRITPVLATTSASVSKTK